MLRMRDAAEDPDFGRALQGVFQASGLSQKELVAKAKVARTTVYRVLAGTLQPTVPVASRLASALDTTVGQLLGETPAEDRVASVGAGHLVGVPLVAEEIAAGNGSLPEVPDDRTYWFREEWIRGLGYRQPGRFACIRLANTARASSMLPTIPPLSVVLVDRKARRDRPQARSIWLVEDGEGPVVKRVTLVDAGLVIESDNPAPQYHARFISLKDRPVQDVLRGRVVWWAVET